MAKSRRGKRKTKGKGAAAVALLKADHRKVEGLFERYGKARSTSVKSRLARQICLALSVHTAIEEELFYPAVAGAVDEETHDEAYVEHDGAKTLIAELLEGSPEDDFYDAKVKVLSEMIRHHVKEEEQRGGLFAQALKDHIDFGELNRRMRARKSQLVEKMKGSGVPLPFTRTMRGVELEHSTPDRA